MTRSLVSLSPFTELRRVADMMDRVFEPAGDSSLFNERMGGGFSVPVDIWEKDNKIMVKAAAPGVKPEDLDVTVEESVLTISGEIRNAHEETQNESKVYHREFRYGRFSRSVRLPEDIDVDAIDAEFNNGFVTVTIPKKIQPTAQPKRLQVRDTSGEAETKSIGANAEEAAKN